MPASAEHARDEGYDQEHEEYVEDDLRDAGGRPGDADESEQSGDEGDDEKDESPTEHGKQGLRLSDA